MSTAHTPGPWEWDGNTLRPSNPDPNTSSVHSILDADGGFGFLGSDWRKTILELDACRAVIAAAPDLLEALQVQIDEHRRRQRWAISDLLGIARSTIELI